MSADLFAAFGNPVEPTETSKQNTSDPFSFLAPSAPTSQSQTLPLPTAWQTAQTLDSNEVGGEQLPLSQGQPQAQTRNDNTWGDLTGFGAAPAAISPAVVKEAELDEDGWGDFEVATQQKIPPVAALDLSALESAAVRVPEPEFSPRTRILRASTLDLIANKLVDDGASGSKVEPWQERPSWDRNPKQDPQMPKPKPKHQDPNVLFDADDFDGVAPDDDDEFGDFETVPSQATKSVPTTAETPAPAVDLLGLDYDPVVASTRKQPPTQLLSTLSLQHSPYPNAPKSPSFSERNPFPGLGLTTPRATEFPKEVKEKEPSPVTAWPTVGVGGVGEEAKRNSFENQWREFELESPAEPKKPISAATKTRAAKANSFQPTPSGKDETDWKWEDWGNSEVPEKTHSPAKEVSGPPPTNIPPPSILLSLFPELLNLTDTALFKPLNGKSAPIKDRVLSDPGTLDFLRGYLALAAVAARVIAGRKLRWHRDKFLSQSMTISAAGGKGGMKLAGIDKSQAAREDREAADMVSVWRDGVGRLRGAVAAANAAITKEGSLPLRLPELSDSVAVQTAKNVPTASKACVICGLKRDERVPRVDIEVEDSFGEWWFDFWGHRTCRNFWLEHEAKLRQR